MTALPNLTVPVSVSKAYSHRAPPRQFGDVFLALAFVGAAWDTHSKPCQ